MCEGRLLCSSERDYYVAVLLLRRSVNGIIHFFCSVLQNQKGAQYIVRHRDNVFSLQSRSTSGHRDTTHHEGFPHIKSLENRYSSSSDISLSEQECLI